jgi:nucleoid-associated protein YgaU
MFERRVDTERTFGQDWPMARTRVRSGLPARSRRRRAAAVLAIVVATGLLIGPVASASDHGSGGQTAASFGRYVVRPGDTLWAIARRAEPGSDPRPMIQAIQEANDLEPGDLIPGRTLLIPSAP